MLINKTTVVYFRCLSYQFEPFSVTELTTVQTDFLVAQVISLCFFPTVHKYYWMETCHEYTSQTKEKNIFTKQITLKISDTHLVGLWLICGYRTNALKNIGMSVHLTEFLNRECPMLTWLTPGVNMVGTYTT